MPEPIIPATPAQAATPGSGAQNQSQSQTGSPASTQTGDKGNQQDGMVSLSAKEYRDLVRNSARWNSFQRRSQFGPPRNNPHIKQGINSVPSDDQEGNLPDEAIAAIQQAQQSAGEATTRAFRAELSSGVRDILDRPEYMDIPMSTKRLITKSPWTLSEQDDVEAALIDIEEYLENESLLLKQTPNTQRQEQQPVSQPGSAAVVHEVPMSSGSGAPAPGQAVQLEDINNLTGVARSRAVLRNSIRQKTGKVMAT